MLGVVWSTPARSIDDGTTYLFPIPSDIYLEIFDHIQPSPDRMTYAEYRTIMSNLTSVCRLFYVICRPKLFEQITFNFHPSYSSFRKRNTWCGGLLKGDTHALALCAYVQRCEFVGGGNHFSIRDLINTGDSKLFLKSWTNINSLTLYHLLLPPAFFETLLALESLRCLNMKYCVLTPSYREKRSSSSITTRLTDLTILSMEIPPPYINDIAVLAPAATLRLLHIDSIDLVLPLIGFSACPSLESLKLMIDATYFPIEKWWTILGNTMNLTTLSINFRDRRREGVFPATPKFSSSHLPKLQTLTCPCTMAPHFISGRPLRKVHILQRPRNFQPMDPQSGTDSEDDDNDEASFRLLKALRASTGPLTALHIPHWYTFLVPMHEWFPCLRELHLSTRGYSVSAALRQITQMCERWQQTPPVEVFSLLWPPTSSRYPIAVSDLEIQHDVVALQIGFAYRTARAVRLNEFIEWRKTDSMGWKPAVIKRQELKTVLLVWCRGWSQLSNPSPLRDMGGCLSELFAPGEISDEMRGQLGLPYY